jgi:hypothetical protein
MAAKKGGSLAGLVILILLLCLLAALNPSQADFKAHLGQAAARQAQGELGKSLLSALGKLPSAVFTRRSYIFASSFAAPGQKGDLYLGLAKVLFIKLR